MESFEPWVIVAIWLGVIVILVVAFRVYPRKPKPDYKMSAKDAVLNGLSEFSVAHLLLKSSKNKKEAKVVHGFAIDKDAQNLCVITAGKTEIFHYKDLIEVQVDKNGQKTHHYSRIEKFAGTPIGDVVVESYDRFGAPKFEKLKIFGVATPIKVETNKFKNSLWAKLLLQGIGNKPAPDDIVIKLIVNDLQKPFRALSLLETEEPDEETMKTAGREAEIWFKVLEKALKDADVSPPEPNIIAMCVADEIAKLMGLKQEGVISEDEFLTVKKRLIYADA